jgi:hypothetical protein
MSQEDNSASELDHPEEILWVVFPANDNATKVMKPSEQALDLPTAAVATRCGNNYARNRPFPLFPKPGNRLKH